MNHSRQFYGQMPQRMNPYVTYLHGASQPCDDACSQNRMGCSSQFTSCGLKTCTPSPIEPMCPCARDCCASSGDPTAYKCVCGDVVQVKPNRLGATNALRNCIPPADWSRYMS